MEKGLIRDYGDSLVKLGEQEHKQALIEDARIARLRALPDAEREDYYMHLQASLCKEFKALLEIPDNEHIYSADVDKVATGFSYETSRWINLDNYPRLLLTGSSSLGLYIDKGNKGSYSRFHKLVEADSLQDESMRDVSYDPSGQSYRGDTFYGPDFHLNHADSIEQRFRYDAQSVLKVAKAEDSLQTLQTIRELITPPPEV